MKTGEAFDSTKSGYFDTNVKEVMTYQVNWDKVKTFEDLLLLLKHNVIQATSVFESDLKGKDKDIKKFFKATGAKVMMHVPDKPNTD